MYTNTLVNNLQTWHHDIKNCFNIIYCAFVYYVFYFFCCYLLCIPLKDVLKTHILEAWDNSKPVPFHTKPRTKEILVLIYTLKKWILHPALCDIIETSLATAVVCMHTFEPLPDINKCSNGCVKECPESWDWRKQRKCLQRNI